MAGILKVDQYQDFNGNNIMTSDGSGNLTLNNTALKMTPAFEAHITTEQNPSGGTDTKINFDNEIFDTDGAYDTSNKRFTVPSGEDGKYHFYCDACIGGSANSSLNQNYIYIYKNGVKTNMRAHFNTNNDGNGRYYQLTIGTTMALVAGDYIEAYGRADLASGTVEIRIHESRFGGYKLIGV